MFGDTRPESLSSLEQLAAPASSSAPVRPSSRWGKRGLIMLGVIVPILLAVALIAATTSSKSLDVGLTHKISRGDLVVTVTEQGLLESAENTEIKCQVRGQNTVLWVIETGTVVQPGDELIRLDTLNIQEQIDERTKYAHWSRSAAEFSAANVARLELAVEEYEKGRYVAELMNREKDLVVAEADLRAAQNMLRFAQEMAKSGYVSQLELEEREFAVQQARLDVDVKRTQLDVLKKYTRAEQLETLRGNLAAAKANHEANVERAQADASRRDRALDELNYCVIRAERGGLVIHPSAARWEYAPEIYEGATVYKDQVLLLMPDLSQMQVKVGVHESVVDRVTEGQPAKVTLPDKTVEGTVSSVASVTRPAGWWTGNEVRYDTLIDLPPADGLRPGMSAEVEIVIAEYEDVLKIPVAAVVEAEEGDFCWVKSDPAPKRRRLELGDSDGAFTIVNKGLQEGDEVLLNPMALREARLTVEKTVDETKRALKPKSVGTRIGSKP